jgi:AcrR family transcriptional regulator
MESPIEAPSRQTRQSRHDAHCAGEGISGTDRRSRILNATVASFGTLGYYGTSLQSIATAVGLTKAGLLHYVKSKTGLLNLVLAEIYDKQTEEIVKPQNANGVCLISEYFRGIVRINAGRPQMVHMFSTLSAEALNPEHPAHDYFVQREGNLINIARQSPWQVPKGIDAESVFQTGFCAMDGLQLRWLRDDEHDLISMWKQCEDALFPLPLWNGCR